MWGQPRHLPPARCHRPVRDRRQWCSRHRHRRRRRRCRRGRRRRQWRRGAGRDIGHKGGLGIRQKKRRRRRLRAACRASGRGDFWGLQRTRQRQPGATHPNGGRPSQGPWPWSAGGIAPTKRPEPWVLRPRLRPHPRVPKGRRRAGATAAVRGGGARGRRRRGGRGGGRRRQVRAEGAEAEERRDDLGGKARARQHAAAVGRSRRGLATL
mmetsp:Transcript_121360/g.387953  ORF Transcript_121360/g.387953 Transcript_121360/m.387953 type:complete len:210 (+) Transcript_121360:176-805(+)